MEDLAEGHMVALLAIHKEEIRYEEINLGSGISISVLEFISAFEKATGQKIKKTIVARRAGDLPIYYADPKKARVQLGWQTVKTLNDICASTWRWHNLGKKLMV